MAEQDVDPDPIVNDDSDSDSDSESDSDDENGDGKGKDKAKGKEKERGELESEEGRVPTLSSLCITFIKKNHDAYPWEFYRLPFSLRELVEDIGPLPIVKLKRRLHFLDSPKHPITTTLLRDWLRCIPQPYSALSTEIILSLNAELVTIRVSGPPGIIGYHTFLQLFQLWYLSIATLSSSLFEPVSITVAEFAFDLSQ